MDVLNRIEQGLSSQELFELLNVANTSDYVVVYLRLITSEYLQRESTFFENFIDGNRSLEFFNFAP